MFKRGVVVECRVRGIRDQATAVRDDAEHAPKTRIIVNYRRALDNAHAAVGCIKNTSQLKIRWVDNNLIANDTA